jgi:hypothetical protein
MDLPNVSRSLENLIFAYAQAPWRTQRQRIGSLLLAVLGFAMVAALYLDITSQAAIAGRKIQEMSAELITVQQANGNLRSQLAEATSATTMEARAKSLGYRPVDPVELQYVVVPGYVPPEVAMLAGAQSLRPSAANLAPEYTESLITWLSQRLGSSGANAGGGLP